MSEQQLKESPCKTCQDRSSCPVLEKHGEGLFCPFIIDNQAEEENVIEN